MLPPVELLERRLYLGGMAASALADFAPSSSEAPLASETLLLEDQQQAARDEPVRRTDAGENPPPETMLSSSSTAASTTPVVPATAIIPTSFGPVLNASPLFTAEPPPAESNSSAEQLAETKSSSPQPALLPGPTGGSSFSATSAAVSSAPAGGHVLPSAAGKAAGNSATNTDAASNAVRHHSQPETEQQSLGTLSTPAIEAALEAAQLKSSEVGALLDRASAATASDDAIIAVVDRNGRILGVRVEDGVDPAITGDEATLVFAIDGAVAKARTAALFSNGEFRGKLGEEFPDFERDSLAPLTSRTVRFISQSTVSQREVQSNPNVAGGSLAEALASTERGPGFVAPIGVGGHFPPEIMNTPPVDLFAIEHTNRDSNLHPGADGIRGTGDDFLLRTSGTDTDGETVGRFNINPAFVPGVDIDGNVSNQALYAPESYGSVENSGRLLDAQSRGIATLPGGIPLFRDVSGDGFGDTLVGGIGVFFPGTDGTATFEQGFVAGIGQTEAERTNAPKVLEAEFIAVAAAGGSLGAEAWIPGAKVGAIGGVAPVADLDIPFGRLDLVGITLEVIGPASSKIGIQAVLDRGAEVGPGVVNGTNQPLNRARAVGDADTDPVSPVGVFRAGKQVADGILVTPHASTVDDLTAADVQMIIDQAIAAANETRAAVRLPLSSRTKMVFAVADSTGEILGLYRMRNATTFSIDVAVAKARNTAYYADATAIQDVDRVRDSISGDLVEAGAAFTNRTFRFVSEPRFPDGIDGEVPDFSILNDGAIAQFTAENLGAPDPVSEFNRVNGSVKGYDAFFPMTNFRDPGDAGVVAAGGAAQPLANQNGIVFFPGSTPLYKDGALIGGFGVSGDGVDQDDVVTFLGAKQFLPPDPITRADEVFVDGVRLPYQKFLRNPFG